MPDQSVPLQQFLSRVAWSRFFRRLRRDLSGGCAAVGFASAAAGLGVGDAAGAAGGFGAAGAAFAGVAFVAASRGAAFVSGGVVAVFADGCAAIFQAAAPRRVSLRPS
ncbi:MAG: hypothetical protein HWD60_16290 [Defluviicoccus sp.]|nr:MAG: hypothetical protein HWD60_16290 [Defluviicoccus sp.]